MYPFQSLCSIVAFYLQCNTFRNSSRIVEHFKRLPTLVMTEIWKTSVSMQIAKYVVVLVALLENSIRANSRTSFLNTYRSVI